MNLKLLQFLYTTYWNDCVEYSITHNIDPWKLVRIYNKEKNLFITLHGNPRFEWYIDSKWFEIEFALTFIDSTPVFKGDILYTENGEQLTVRTYNRSNGVFGVYPVDKIDDLTYIFKFSLSLKPPMKNIELTLNEANYLMRELAGIRTFTATMQDYNTASSILEKLEK